MNHASTNKVFIYLSLLFYVLTGTHLFILYEDELIPVGRMEINPVNKLDKISGYCSSTQPGNTGSFSLVDVDLPQDEDKSMSSRVDVEQGCSTCSLIRDGGILSSPM